MSRIYRFIVEVFSKYYFLENDISSRRFLCLLVEDRAKRVINLIDSVDDILHKFNKPNDVYYVDPKLHISIASMPSNECSHKMGNLSMQTINVSCNYIPKDKRINYFSSNVIPDNDNAKIDNESDSDSNSEIDFKSFLSQKKVNSSDTHNHSKVTASNSDDENNEVVCTKLGISVDVIECKIGDRLFRLTLRANATSLSEVSSECAFHEVFS